MSDGYLIFAHPEKPEHINALSEALL